MKAYKCLSRGRIGPYSGWQWPEVGEWTPEYMGQLVECTSGYHLCRREDLVYWLNNEIYEAEMGAVVIECENKILCRRARLIRRLDAWNERTARLFACDCAEHVLPLWTAQCSGDHRPADAIAVARRHAEGKASDNELIAARAAARAAARDAARAAARAAAWDAAWDAARDAAGAAARDAERAWQTERLFWYLDAKEEA